MEVVREEYQVVFVANPDEDEWMDRRGHLTSDWEQARPFDSISDARWHIRVSRQKLHPVKKECARVVIKGGAEKWLNARNRWTSKRKQARVFDTWREAQDHADLQEKHKPPCKRRAGRPR